jgi:hypothetical protein
MIENLIPSAGAIVAGGAMIATAVKNRGTYSYRNGVHVSCGDGWSAKIIKKFKGYGKLSPHVDHVLAGAGYASVFCGCASLYGASNHDSLAYKMIITAIPLAYSAYHLWWEAYSVARRKKSGQNYGIADLTQVAIDLSVPIAVSRLFL